jgi:hypothetical protein
LLSHWRRWREARLLKRFAIPESLWQQMLGAHSFIACRSAEDLARLRRLCSLFLARKRFHAVGDLVPTDAMALAVAAQACLPVLHLDLGLYDDQVGIVLHPGDVRAQRQEVDEHGVVHEWEEELAGEAMPGGPLMLSWESVRSPDLGAPESEQAPAFNVVIHEFIHLLDLGNGACDGLPAMTDLELARTWVVELPLAWDRFADRIAHREPSCIDAYGVPALDEFFAVAGEAFFVRAAALSQEDPALYALLARYFRQDPASCR